MAAVERFVYFFRDVVFAVVERPRVPVVLVALVAALRVEAAFAAGFDLVELDAIVKRVEGFFLL